MLDQFQVVEFQESGGEVERGLRAQALGANTRDRLELSDMLPRRDGE